MFKWLALAALGAVVTLSQYLLSPLLALCTAARLPGWLSWFQTPVDPLLGDAGHYARWAGWPPYIQRWAWLLRNPADGYDTRVAGATIDSLAWLRVSGDPLTSNRPGHSGWCYATCRGYWMFYYVRQWGDSGRCVRLYIGWKLMSAVHGYTGRFPLVLAFNPLMGFARPE